MNRSVLRVAAAVTLSMSAAAALHASMKFLSTFKSMDAGSVAFVGKKVAAVVISDDDSLRVAGEEALARELSARGLDGVASYKIAPREELRKVETAKLWLERAGIEGVVAIRPVSQDKRMGYNPGTWVSPNYGTLWGYWGTGWGSVYVPGSARQETVVVVETTIYSVTRNQLLWAAVTETSDPKNLQQFVEELVKESVKQLHEQGLARRTPR